MTLLIACCAGAPTVVLVPALPGDREPVRLAEPVHVKVWVQSADGTTIQSRNRVELPAGGWYFWYEPAAEPNEAGQAVGGSIAPGGGP